MKIHAFHLYNDFSGSPKVLQQLVWGWHNAGLEVRLYSSFGQRGFLSDLPVQEIDNRYSLKQNTVLKLLRFFYSNFLMGWQLAVRAKSGDLVYVNTALPFFPMWVGHWRGLKVIGHVHESSIKPKALKGLLSSSLKWACDALIYVSYDLVERMPISGPRRKVIYNSLPASYQAESSHTSEKLTDVLMVCSLKKYKGVDLFTDLAARMPQYRFKLVLNAEEEEINQAFTEEVKALPNLTLLSGKGGVQDAYKESRVLLNLSLPDQWVETFGLTALEAMSYGLPCLVPNVGGIAEVVQDGIEGFCLNPYALDEWESKIKLLLEDTLSYSLFSHSARERAKHFSEKAMLEAHFQFLSELLNGNTFHQMEYTSKETNILY